MCDPCTHRCRGVCCRGAPGAEGRGRLSFSRCCQVTLQSAPPVHGPASSMGASGLLCVLAIAGYCSLPCPPPHFTHYGEIHMKCIPSSVFKNVAVLCHCSTFTLFLAVTAMHLQDCFLLAELNLCPLYTLTPHPHPSLQTMATAIYFLFL